MRRDAYCANVVLLSDYSSHVFGVLEIREFHDIRAFGWPVQQDVSSADVTVDPARLVQDLEN